MNNGHRTINQHHRFMINKMLFVTNVKMNFFLVIGYRLDLNAADSGVQQKILQCETNTNVEKDKSCMQC